MIRTRTSLLAIGSSLSSVILFATLCSSATAAEISGEAIYKQRCAVCHEKPTDRAPPRQALSNMQPLTIATALMSGAMKQQASGLSQDEVIAVATFLGSGARGNANVSIPQPTACAKSAPPMHVSNSDWNGWSPDLENTRYQPKPGFKSGDVRRLKLKWAYGYSGRMAYGEPTLVGNRIIVTNSLGDVAALDANTGCSFWVHRAEAGVRSAVSVGEIQVGTAKKYVVFFGDEKAHVVAIDAQTGESLWSIKLDEHPYARVTGAVRYYDGKLFVPMSSIEEVPGRDAKYECCKFRGSVSALDAATGKILWKSYPIQNEPKPFKKNPAGTQMFGPAGAAIWSSPTIDVKRKLIYVGTGNSYTDVDTDGNDAIAAFDMITGERKWISQASPKDNYLVGCSKANAGQANCPEGPGPDHDFGSSPILQTMKNGKQIILDGQKSGVAWGFDPDNNGKIIWQQRVGTGSALGGVEWGPAADKDHYYVAISDIAARDNPQPGITALNLTNGEKVWSTPTPTVKCSFSGGRCSRGQPGAVSVIPGVVFSGALDGHMRAYSAVDGKILWDFDTGVEFQTVNGVAAKGGSIDASGAVIGDGMVLVNSGYGSWGAPGHVMLVFTVDGK